MDKAFNFAFESLTAQGIETLLGAGLVFLLLGVFLTGHFLYLQLFGIHCRAEIIAVLTKGYKEKNWSENPRWHDFQNEMYTLKFKYTLPSGQTTEAISACSKNWLGNYIIGDDINVILSPHNHQSISTVSLLWPFVGAIMFAFGLFLITTAFEFHQNSLFTILILLSLIGGAAWKMFKSIKPREEWETVSEFQERKNKEHQDRYKDAVALTQDEINMRRYIRAKASFQGCFLPLGMAALFFWAGTEMLNERNPEAFENFGAGMAFFASIFPFIMGIKSILTWPRLKSLKQR